MAQNSFLIPLWIFMILFAFIYFGSRGFENMVVIAEIFSGIAIKRLITEGFIQQ